MKSLLKFSLLSALIVGGKFAKTTTPVTAAQPVAAQTRPDTSSVVLVHQVLTSEPVKPTREQRPQQSGSGFITEMF
ncbi:hypothetical protein JAO73_16145 [Hymenobacter sp. BT523]|uniref:hypothetical protein n=1 Tax=Hymenobacter sp. BT523 TaxID=2795725 RepID=UPI0018ED676D|nr:hypothetical protein [Hymenobacter sp. BT523]MBJ6110556.1 hypothetical protein [Hymenobacter sp. BT523]